MYLFCTCNESPLRIPVEEFDFTNIASLQPATVLKTQNNRTPCFKK